MLPGLVDTHVHINEPGRTHWEGFATATAAAAAGGCTCVVDMPLNSIPATTTVSALLQKRDLASKQCLIDYAFWGGVIPGNENELIPLAEAGVRGFKCFLVDSGVSEFQRVTEDDLNRAMPVIAETGLPLLVHAELPGPIKTATSQIESSGPGWLRYATYLESRPDSAELEAVDLMVRLCRKHQCRVHIVHLGSGAALPLLERAKAEGLPITVETCPHYLYFTAEQIPNQCTHFKCAPPIRSAANQELLWRGLRSGIIDLIATDHSPCPPEMKNSATGDFASTWGGIASLSLALPVIWTVASKRGFTLDQVSKWISKNTAELAGLGSCKGEIRPGCDADFVIFDPDAQFRVTPESLHFRHACTPYLGEMLNGQVVQTFVRGQRVFANGQPEGEIRGREAIAAVRGGVYSM